MIGNDCALGSVTTGMFLQERCKPSMGARARRPCRTRPCKSIPVLPPETVRTISRAHYCAIIESNDLFRAVVGPEPESIANLTMAFGKVQ